MFDAASTLERLLHSIVGQNYTNWKLILIDDVSEPHQKLLCQTMISKFKQLDKSYEDKIEVIWNTEKKWETANVLHGISLCADDDIVGRIDADDYLVDLDALAIMNVMYNEVGCECMWSMHRWGLSDTNISSNMTNDADPYRHLWVSSHFKTFRKKLLNNVPYENFLNHENELVKRAGDQAIYLPILHNTNKRFFLPRVLYHYTIDDLNGAIYQTDDAKFQKREADFLRARGYVNQGVSWEEKIKCYQAR